ncbi:AAA family ATPase [Candidatus Gracilibacteria bacterium]|nr:AAA family ATPase [Candidatus Gracilibacteria bacterium]
MFKKNKVAIKALRMMNKTSKNIYLTGEAGTGKSTLLRDFISKTTKNTAILAPTGLSAINVGGETIHSFCKFSLDPGFKIIQDNKIHRLKSRKKLKALDTIIIDEISMVRADTLDAMNIFFQINIGNKKPFGGLQLILIGDHFQLPPILRADQKTEYSKLYYCEYFFAAKVFFDLKLNFFKLTQIYRQEDSQYIKLLSYLRYGIQNPSLIKWINTNLVNKPIKNKSLPVTIATRNLDVTKFNHTKLESLSGEVRSYKAIIEGDFKKETFPTDKYLVLKEKAQIMFIKNDLERNWVNGTIGKIDSLYKDYIVVKLPNGKKSK